MAQPASLKYNIGVITHSVDKHFVKVFNPATGWEYSAVWGIEEADVIEQLNTLIARPEESDDALVEEINSFFLTLETN